MCFIGFCEENRDPEMRQSLGVSAAPSTSAASSPSIPSCLAAHSGRQESFVPQDSGLSPTPQAASKQSVPFVLKCCVGALVTHLSLHSACSQSLAWMERSCPCGACWALRAPAPLGSDTEGAPRCPEVCAVGRFILHCHWQCFCSPDTFQTAW